MKNLPVEIFEQIFELLHQKDKVECLTVCRAWKNALENTVLSQVVRLKSTEQLDKLVEKMGREPIWRREVKRLIIDMEHINIAELDMFSLLLSNVREVVFYEKFRAIDLRFTKQLSPHTWSGTIRRIKEKNSRVFTYNILMGGVCSFLTDITTCGNQKESGTEFIALLGNAPTLKFLDIKNFSLTLSDLELLHKQAPLLVSLTLKLVSFRLDDIPTDVIPADSMMKLSVSTRTIFTHTTYSCLLEYFTSKYIKISDLAHFIAFDTRYKIEPYMSIGLVPYIKQIAPYLTTFLMPNCKSLQYIIPALDQCNCYLKEFNLTGIMDASGISKIVESNQVQSIEKLTINKLSGDFFMTCLSKLTALTELHLYYNKTQPNPKIDVTVNSLLRSIESALTTLTLVETNIKLDSSSIQPCPSLKTLVLKYSNLPQGIDLFIHRALPNLRKLVMDHCS